MLILLGTFAVVLAVPLFAFLVVGLQRSDVILGAFLLAPTAFWAVLLAAAGPSKKGVRRACRWFVLVTSAVLCVIIYARASDAATAVTLVAFAAAVAVTVAVDTTVP